MEDSTGEWMILLDMGGLLPQVERETARTGRKLTQREFILGLVEKALEEAESQAGVGPCEGGDTTDGSQP